MLSSHRLFRLPGLLFLVGAFAATSASAQYHLGTRYGSGSTGSTGSGGETGNTGETGGGGDTGSTGSNGSGDGGSEQTYGPSDTDLGGGTVTLARAIFNGGTVSNGTVSATTHDAYAGEVTAVLTGGSLTKSTSDIFTISSASTYAGLTTIQQGTLKLGAAGSINTSSAIKLAAGATFDVSAVSGGFSLGAGHSLSGDGNVLGKVSVADGATLFAGTNGTPGTLTFADGLTLQSGSALKFDLGSVSDLITVSGDMLTGPSSGAVTLNFNDTGDFAAGTYTLFNFAGATRSDFDLADFSLGNAPDGFDYYIDFNGSTLQLTTYAVTAVPEPASVALGIGMAGLVAAIVRRRRLALRRTA